MRQITDIVKNLIIVNVVIYLVTMLVMPQVRDLLIFHYPAEGNGFQPLQIITHMFMHAPGGGDSLLSMHLLFNMVGLYFFGPPLEALWGGKRFLFFYFFAGLGAVALHTLVSFIKVNYYGGTPGAMLGASGAISGIVVGFAYHYPNQKISLIFPPVSLAAKYFVPILLLIDLSLGLGRVGTGIAHFAHLGGALFGFLLIMYWQKFGSRL